VYAYGPPLRGIALLKREKTSASSTAPVVLTSQPTTLMPPYNASEAGSRKIPDPIMLPTTRAVLVHRPRLRGWAVGTGEWGVGWGVVTKARGSVGSRHDRQTSLVQF
jgi:hypothetical protein